MALLIAFAVAAVASGAYAATPAPPAWACGKLTDYYAAVTTECAPASCNAMQRNLGGDLIVLDVQSYGTKSCQGCNPSIPSTCCKACQDQDRCNAWVLCTNKDGCGSGCASYAKQFKAPLAYDDKLPHKFWGNWGSCSGDKWSFGTCSLKTVADVKNPPVTSSKASDGWVSGVVPKVAADPRCPPTLSAKSCKRCLATKDPALCTSCITKAARLDAPEKCAACASLASKAGRDACVACAAAASRAGCSQCFEADCSDADCMNARMKAPEKAPNLGAVDACFACQGAAAAVPGKAAACSGCFETWNVPKESRGACLSCLASSVAAAAAGCAGCAGANVKDKAACTACTKKAKAAGDAVACGLCSDANNVPAAHTAACHACALAAPDENGKRLCSNLERGAAAADVAAYYKCLSTARGADAPNNCLMCHRAGSLAAAQGCYACLGKVSGPSGIHCSHCWVPSRMAAKAGAESVAAKCEKCVVDKDKAKAAGDSCWS